MNDFALVTEGITDHAILKAVLLGYFKSKNQRAPEIHHDFPDPQAAKHIGGWTLVLRYLREEKFLDAFDFCQFVIVQIDTDVCAEPGFDVPRQNASGPLTTPQLIEKVIERLRVEIGPEHCATFGDRFLFAIGVDQLECWLMPLWDSRNSKQTVNCTEKLHRAPKLQEELNKKNYPWIRAGKKDFQSYELAAKPYLRGNAIQTQGRECLSLDKFLFDLDQLNILLAPTLDC